MTQETATQKTFLAHIFKFQANRKIRNYAFTRKSFVNGLTWGMTRPSIYIYASSSTWWCRLWWPWGWPLASTSTATSAQSNVLK